ncbi:unnamed protein product [Vicia faba]|uniref:DUF4283 domain-containing protein n=1 Tax=Vicia faba TaxID=3906 RepID=A0AAV0ZWR4_VICFA|nr:unnamed protein product [Vicia faba]
MDVGILSLEVIPMGGNKVFIKVQEEEDFHTLFKEAKEFFQYWFTKVEEWYPKAVMNGKITWIKMYGVPIQAWNQKFFEKLIIGKGSLVFVGIVTEKKRMFDYARCLIRKTSMESLNKAVQVKVNGHIYNIKLKEEEFSCPVDIQTMNQSLENEDFES